MSARARAALERVYNYPPDTTKEPVRDSGALLRILEALSRLSGQALATLGAAAANDLLTVLGRHAETEAMAALADEAARLIGAFRSHRELQKS